MKYLEFVANVYSTIKNLVKIMKYLEFVANVYTTISSNVMCSC